MFRAGCQPHLVFSGVSHGIVSLDALPTEIAIRQTWRHRITAFRMPQRDGQVADEVPVWSACCQKTETNRSRNVDRLGQGILLV